MKDLKRKLPQIKMLLSETSKYVLYALTSVVCLPSDYHLNLPQQIFLMLYFSVSLSKKKTKKRRKKKKKKTQKNPKDFGLLKLLQNSVNLQSKQCCGSQYAYEDAHTHRIEVMLTSEV